jgi:alpha-ketoglutarate-dependent taurine dioxygenase
MTRLQVTDIGPVFGCEIAGVDLGHELDAGTRATLRSLFDDRGALLFRGVDIDDASQRRLCRMLIGEEGVDEAGGVPRFISNVEPEGLAPFGRLLFHVDSMWSPEPFQVLSLYASNVEPGAATTSLVSAVHAWETLPADLQARVEGLHAVQFAGQVMHRGGDDLLNPEFALDYSAVTPIARRHPRTGKTILYVSQQMTREIVELPPDESEELLQALFAHLYDPAVVYEHEWRTGDLIVFDNLTLQHARGNVELHGPSRTLRKVMLPVPKDIAEMTKPRYTTAAGA